jgi:hypothetical protein
MRGTFLDEQPDDPVAGEDKVASRRPQHEGPKRKEAGPTSASCCPACPDRWRLRDKRCGYLEVSLSLI